jgi:sodium transport system permease protein
MWYATRAVASKELIEALRDRRSLMSALLYGLWGPMVMALALTALARDRRPDRPLTIALEGRAGVAALASFLAERNATVVEAPPGVADRIRARDVTVAVVVTDRYATELDAQRPARLGLLFDASWAESRAAADRLRALLDEYGRRITANRLILRGISPAAIRPLKIVEQDLSTAAGRAAAVLSTLPIFLLVSAFVGGMGISADAMAGERERGSLESLLIHPVPRPSFVLGKWAAAAIVSLATVTLTLATSQAILRHPRIQALDLPVGLSGADLAAMWLVVAPLALAVASIQILIALGAKTYKEAQTHLSLLIFLPMVPGFLFAFGSVDAAAWMRWTPLVGQHLLIGDILRGDVPSPGHTIAVTLLTLAAGAVGVLMASSLLNRESIVRRAA